MSEYCGDLPLSKLFFSESLFEKFVLSPFRSRNFFCLSLSLTIKTGVYIEIELVIVFLFFVIGEACTTYGPQANYGPRKLFFDPQSPKCHPMSLVAWKKNLNG